MMVANISTAKRAEGSVQNCEVNITPVVVRAHAPMNRRDDNMTGCSLISVISHQIISQSLHKFLIAHFQMFCKNTQEGNASKIAIYRIHELLQIHIDLPFMSADIFHFAFDDSLDRQKKPF